MFVKRCGEISVDGVVMVLPGFLLRVAPVSARWRGKRSWGVSEGMAEFRGGMMVVVPRGPGRPSPGSSRST